MIHILAMVCLTKEDRELTNKSGEFHGDILGYSGDPIWDPIWMKTYGLKRKIIIQLVKIGTLRGQKPLSDWVFLEHPPAIFVSTRVPSGKRSHSYGKSQFLMGNLTINDHFQ